MLLEAVEPPATINDPPTIVALWPIRGGGAPGPKRTPSSTAHRPDERRRRSASARSRGKSTANDRGRLPPIRTTRPRARRSTSPVQGTCVALWKALGATARVAELCTT
jgi:hypothetical protein